MYPSRYTEVTSVSAESMVIAHEFAGLQAGIIVRLSCARLSADDLDAVHRYATEIASTVDDAAACSSARRKLVGYLASRTGNPLQQALVDEASLALARSLREYEIPAEHRPAMITACSDLEAALRAGDRNAAEQACRVLYGVN